MPDTPDKLSDLAIRSFVILAGTATLIGASASRHNDLANRMRTLTTECRKCEDDKRKLSLQKQITVFRFRAKASAIGHIGLYCAFVFEVVFYALALGWHTFNFALVNIPLAFICAGVVCHLIEHSRAFTTLNEETSDILPDQTKPWWQFWK